MVTRTSASVDKKATGTATDFTSGELRQAGWLLWTAAEWCRASCSLPSMMTAISRRCRRCPSLRRSTRSTSWSI